jgi:multidrug efflux pump subunit AcrB
MVKDERKLGGRNHIAYDKTEPIKNSCEDMHAGVIAGILFVLMFLLIFLGIIL